MDDCFGNAGIDEDQIVFDFGEGDVEIQDSLQYALDFVPVIDFEGVPEFHPQNNPARDQTLKIESQSIHLRNHGDEETHLETDSSQDVSSSNEHNQNLFIQDDVIVRKSGEISSSQLPPNLLLSSECTTSHFEISDDSIFPFNRISTKDVVQLADGLQSSDTFPLSNSPPTFPPVSSPAFNPMSIPPASPSDSIHRAPPLFIPPALPLDSSSEHPPCSSQPAAVNELTQPNETVNLSSPPSVHCVQFVENGASSPSEILSIIQPSSSSNPPPAPPFPTTYPFHQPISSPTPPLLGSNNDAAADDDDEFDFDELVASRTQFKRSPEQNSTNVEVSNEKKKTYFPSDAEFDIHFDLKVEEIETKLTEDNRIAVLQPGERSEEAFDEAADEWDRVQTIEPEFEEGQTRTLKERVGTEPITFSEAVAVLDHSKLMQQFGTTIRRSVVRGAVASIFHRLCGGPRLHQRLHAERDFAFCLAACPFDNEDAIHCRVLFSIYKQLTGSRFDCPRFGSHWEIIGFQGQDPSTDLRGAGFLALLQLLHLVTDMKRQPLARNLYRLSLHETQNFPFSVMGINLTRITIAAMREDCLNKGCNRRGQLLGVLNDFYFGLCHRLHVIWKTQRKTIRDTGFVLADLESYAKKHPQEMIQTITQIQSTDNAPIQHLDGGTRDIAHIDEHLF